MIEEEIIIVIVGEVIVIIEITLQEIETKEQENIHQIGIGE